MKNKLLWVPLPARSLSSGYYLDRWLSADRLAISVYNQHQGQLSLPSLRGSYIEYWPAWPAVRRGTFTCVGWQVTL